ncbi:MAG: hypothetical protein A2Y10_07215 [Planctomycetes bacterium GWF2_41_51]|nr:MAG: hypothetical protein A2Y10_07215 [Planctomycetes bacterium GWF2_41_51]HBG28518.1 hypothetical protein [Phycisphaerales bacterium]
MAKVNLDALIPREDFEVEEIINSGTKKERISIEDIKPDSFFFPNLRKPDFQRETNEWEAKKIAEFILSFIKGDLIPAIILWRSTSGYLFVIDGSHRLSALSAWVNNDYGDGKISKLFYDGVIPDEQVIVAEETRKLINKNVGAYEDYKLALTHPDKVRPDILTKAKILASIAIQLQWVEGDASTAENSFFKINQQAAPIDKTELKLLKSRKKPNSIAARAIIRSGKGHKYWSIFSSEKQNEIQALASEINEILFSPKLQTPIKTLDIPIGGKLYSAQSLPLILDFVNIVNGIESFSKTDLENDPSGEKTIDILKKTRKVAWRINSNHPSSLGLHPIIYFYSQDGRHKVASFFSIVDLLMTLEKRNKMNDFIKSRKDFEILIQKYDYLVQQINRKHRSVQASYKFISEFFLRSIDMLNMDKTPDEAINMIIKETEYNYLTLSSENEFPSNQKDFSTGKKSAIYIKQAIQGTPKCKICGGLIHRNSISIDHIQRKADGGLADIENGQITHPYCNTGYKN